MKPKTLSKIISFYFILTFAFLGGIGSIMNMPNKLIPDLNVVLGKDEVVVEKRTDIMTESLGTPSEIIPPSTSNKFYMDPNFYFKSTVGGVVGYILRYILDFISIGLRALAGRLF